MVGQSTWESSTYLTLSWASVRLPKIKAWIDENNPGDPLIPFSVALEERLSAKSTDDPAEEDPGAASALGKITTAGYASLDVSISDVSCDFSVVTLNGLHCSSFDTSRVVQTRRVHGRFEEVPKRPRPRVSSSGSTLYNETFRCS
jgi:hypothetical protein